MKNRTNVFFIILFSFFLCFYIGESKISAGNCDDTVTGLNITCNATASNNDVPGAIKDDFKKYDAIDLNTYKYQGYGYDFNYLNDELVRLNSITPQDISDTARKFLDLNKILFE